MNDGYKKGQICHAKFDDNIKNLVKELEIMLAMKKHFEEMPKGSYLDEQFCKRYE